MRMRAFWAVAALVLLPAAVAAQEPKADSVAPKPVKKAPAMKIVRLTDREVNRAFPQLQAELMGQTAIDDAMNAMTRSEYRQIKNALMVARLDYRDPSRLESGADERTLDERRMNANYYRINESRLEPVVQRLAPDRSCPLCQP